MSSFPIRRALLSVSDKSGIVPFAQRLQQHGVEILSTGGTAKLLQENNITVTTVSDYTHFPEIMGGRVKTLHPRIHAGLLQRPNIDDEILAEHDITPINLLVVNLYPFEQTIAKPEHSLAEAIENIDIGGPAMLRAGAKNYAATTVLVDPQDYGSLPLDQEISQTQRFAFAQKTFAHVAHYDAAIANYLSSYDDEQQRKTFPKQLTLSLEKAKDLRYGENPHQQAALYVEKQNHTANVANANQLQGKMLSYNNLADADTALQCVKQFPKERPVCVIVKHANPCGVAYGDSLRVSYERALAADPESAFGGIIAFNQVLDVETARFMLSQQFVEVIVAPDVSESAKIILAEKPNIRVLISGHWSQATDYWHYQRLAGGLLVQEADVHSIEAESLQQVSVLTPTPNQYDDLLFAWLVAKYVKSNAIVFVKNGQTFGIGAGQTSRVASVNFAIEKAKQAGLTLAGSVLASDAFFPFKDGVEKAAEAGVKAIIQPGGSKRDAEVIQAADQYQLAMVFTNMRHFRH